MRITTIHARGIAYKLALMDDPEVETDPTLLLFRGDEEEAAVTIHLTPGAPCQEPDHITLEDEDEEEYDDGKVLIAGVLYDAETGEEANPQ